MPQFLWFPQEDREKKNRISRYSPLPPIRSPLENEIAALRNEGTGE